jgi:hypothetical protein
MAKQTGRALSEGCYMVVPPNGDPIPESSEVRALRMAVATKGEMVFVKWGQSIDAATAASKDEPTQAEPKARAARKKAEPAETPAVQPEPVPAAIPEPVPADGPDNF